MNCATVKEKFSAFLDRQLPEAERRAVAEHLDCCLDCAAEASELACVSTLYAQASVLEPTTEWRASVQHKIAALARHADMTWQDWITRLLGRSNVRLRPLLSLRAGIATLITISLAVLSFAAVHSIQTEAHAGVVMSCQVKGMMCDGCAKSVRSILKQLPGVLDAKVDPNAGRARLILKRGAKLTEEDLTTALNRTRGFRLVGLSVERQDKELKKERGD